MHRFHPLLVFIVCATHCVFCDLSVSSETDADRVAQELDAIAAEVDRRNQLSANAEPIRARYERDLVRDLRRVSNEMRLAEQQDLAVAYANLRDQQRRILLKLWHLDRLKPMLAEVDEEYVSLTAKVRTLRRTSGDILRSPEFTKRFEEVARSVEVVERERLKRRMTSDRGFYDMTSMFAASLQDDADRVEPDPEVEERDGALGELALPIQRLVKLQWDHGQFVVDRDHWEDLFPEGSLASIAIEVDRALKGRGLHLSSNAHRGFLPESLFYSREPGVALLYQNLRHAVSQLNHGATKSSARRGDLGGTISTNQIFASVGFADDTFSLLIYEKDGSERGLRLTQNQTSFSIALLSGTDPEIEIAQDATGGAVLRLNQDEPKQTQKASVADLYAANPDLFEQRLFPELSRFGVLVPITRFDDSVIDLVVTKLGLIDSEYVEKLDRLIVEADSPQFEDRTRAMRVLSENAQLYAPLIVEFPGTDSLSLEVRRRLQRITTRYEREFGSMETLLRKLDLVRDPDYLNTIMPMVTAEHRAVISAGLRRLQNPDEGH